MRMADLPVAAHTLVVGGTGMLAGVALELAARGPSRVSVVARTPERLAALVRRAARLPGRIEAVTADWHDARALEAGIRHAIAVGGPIVRVVAWIHSSAPHAPGIVADLVSRPSDPCPFLLVMGSEGDARGEVKRRWTGELSRLPGIAFARVFLGCVSEGDGWRWLTDGEIAHGVLRAMDLGVDGTWVGNSRGR